MCSEVIYIALFSVVFSLILTEPGMLFDWYRNLLGRYDEKYHFLTAPLGYCQLCFAGQVSLWWYLYENWSTYYLPEHIIFISASIFATHIFTFIYIKTR